MPENIAHLRRDAWNHSLAAQQHLVSHPAQQQPQGEGRGMEERRAFSAAARLRVNSAFVTASGAHRFTGP